MQNLKVRKSRTALKRALIELMKKKACSKVTIKELCEKAGLNRSTFYANYTDIQDLLLDIHTDIFNNFSHALVEADLNFLVGTMENRIEAVTEIIVHLQSNVEIFQLLFVNNENNLFERNLSEYYLEKYAVKNADFEKKCVILYHVIGSFTMFRQWLFSKFPCTPRELARLICTQSENAVNLIKDFK